MTSRRPTEYRFDAELFKKKLTEMLQAEEAKVDKSDPSYNLTIDPSPAPTRQLSDVIETFDKLSVHVHVGGDDEFVSSKNESKDDTDVIVSNVPLSASALCVLDIDRRTPSPYTFSPRSLSLSPTSSVSSLSSLGDLGDVTF